MEPLRKPEPLTVMLKAGPPEAAELGERLESEGVGALMAKVSEFEVLPPGDGLDTVTELVPAVATSEEEIAA